MGLLSFLFGGDTKTTTTSTTQASQTTNAVAENGIMANNSNVTTYRDESVTTQLFDSRDMSATITDSRDMSQTLNDSRNMSQTLNDARDQSVTYVDNSQDLSGTVVRDALEFADHQNELNAGLWSKAMTETSSAGKSYAELTGAAYKDANDSVMTIANNFANATLQANANDGEALATSLEKFGKMGVVLILGLGLFAAFRGNR